MSEEKDLNAVAEWLGLSASVIKCGEPWTGTCERVHDQAKTGLVGLASEITRLRGEVERLSRRETDLLAANNRYLMRARDAEVVLGDLLKFASGVETTAAYPTFQRARDLLSSAPKPEEG